MNSGNHDASTKKETSERLHRGQYISLYLKLNAACHMTKSGILLSKLPGKRIRVRKLKRKLGSLLTPRFFWGRN